MKVLVIMGATATGKSELGIRLAQRFNGEIISADSIQVYKELNIGSAKLKPEEMNNIPHHWISMKNIEETSSVADFQTEARELIAQIDQRGKVPIVVGGTGLYIKALLYDYQFHKDLKPERDLSGYSNQELYDRLLQVDPLQAEKIHINNRKRLERYFQSYHQQGKTRTEILQKQTQKPLYENKIYYLTGPRDWLRERFRTRVHKMIAEGLEQEVYEVSEQGTNFEKVALSAIGYRQWAPYFKGEVSREEVIEKIVIATAQFSKRQKTWFRNQLSGTLIDVSEQDAFERIEKEMAQWL